MIFTKEIKEELKIIVREELYKIIFENREFETPMNAYIKSLIYDEVSSQKNKHKFEPTEYIFDYEEHSKIFNTFNIKEGIDFKFYYNKLISEKKIECSYEDFCSTLIDYRGTIKINWVDKSNTSKDYQYSTIFDFLNDISDTDFRTLNSYNRKKLIDFLCRKFLKGSQPMLYGNVNSTFSEWLKKPNCI